MTTKRVPYVAPIIATVDFALRPHSYWADANPIEAITQNIKGQYRREYVRQLLEMSNDERGDGLSEVHVADSLPNDLLAATSEWAQETRGGEFLPDYRRYEVEIARLATIEGRRPVTSIRAKRSPVTGRYTYSIVDEYHTAITLHRKTSSAVLSMGELVDLIDTASSPLYSRERLPFVESMLLEMMVGLATEIEQFDRIRVQSCVYPQLEFYYWSRLKHFVTQFKNRPVRGGRRVRKRG